MSAHFSRRPINGLFADLTHPFVLVEDRLAPGRPAFLYRSPVEIIRCWDAGGVGAAIERIEAAAADGLHAAGFLSYELGYALEPKLQALAPPGQRMPLLLFGLFAKAEPLNIQQLDAAFAALGPPAPVAVSLAHFDRAAHEHRVRQVRDYLFAGDAYQVNLTQRLDFRHSGDPLALYAAMRVRQPVAHGGVIALDDAMILSVSPELFLDVANGQATTRPMKGTVARGSDPESDQALVESLRSDPKQLAENLMIVDLMRNDLSRICVAGSVKAPEMFRVETYPTLHTLTSTVTGQLRQGLRIFDIIRAVFPCGSITGAPKRRAMEIIREIETQPRGVYTGSLGTFAPDGAIRLNVAIRTATLWPDGAGTYGVGGGIVTDSDPAGEYDECLIKARVLTGLSASYALIETLRWTAQHGCVRLDMHLARLAASAAQLGFAYDEAALLDQLSALTERFLLMPEPRRLRIELARGGAVAITQAALAGEADGPLSVAVAPERVDAGDPFLRHKTTRRQLYDAAFTAAAAAGLDEAVFANRDGFVTEASRNTIFLERGGTLITPPLSCGLLPGVLRRLMLERGEASEGEISLEELRRAERWFLGNSLRGLRLAQFVA